MSSIQRRRSTLSLVDNGLLVVAIVVGAVFALWMLGLVIHTVLWLAKLAVAGLVIGYCIRLASRHR